MSDDLATKLVDSLQSAYGAHPGHRAAHAKGVLCHATFTPTADASELSRAPHFQGGPYRAHVRFSNGSGDPRSSDAARDGRGIALKVYAPGGPTDVLGLTLPSFFARTPEDLLEFNAARRPDETGAPNPERVGAYLAEHPEAVPAVTAAIIHPIPRSYAGITYNGIHSFAFSGAGAPTFGRYRFVPATAEEPLSDEEAAAMPPDYLREELASRLAAGPATIHLDVVLAADDDAVDDPTVAWPPDRASRRVGSIEIPGLADDREHDGDILVFDPSHVPDGIEMSQDRILRVRAAAYSVSVQRRTAPTA